MVNASIIIFIIYLIVILIVTGFITSLNEVFKKNRSLIIVSIISISFLIFNSVINPQIKKYFAKKEFEKYFSAQGFIKQIKTYDESTYNMMVKEIFDNYQSITNNPSFNQIMNVGMPIMKKYFRYYKLHASEELVVSNFLLIFEHMNYFQTNNIDICCKLIAPGYFGIHENYIEELPIEMRNKYYEITKAYILSAISNNNKTNELTPADIIAVQYYINRFRANNKELIDIMSNPQHVISYSDKTNFCRVSLKLNNDILDVDLKTKVKLILYLYN